MGRKHRAECVDCNVPIVMEETRSWRKGRCRVCYNKYRSEYTKRAFKSRITLDEGVKICNKCMVEQPRLNFVRSKKNADGRRNTCKSCLNGPEGYYQQNRDKLIAYQKERYDRDSSLEYHRQRKYGLSPREVSEILNAQGGGCAVCGYIPASSDKKGLGLDHCHQTGKVRGLLCIRCNAALGMINDSVDTLVGLIAYLEKYADD